MSELSLLKGMGASEFRSDQSASVAMCGAFAIHGCASGTSTMRNANRKRLRHNNAIAEEQHARRRSIYLSDAGTYYLSLSSIIDSIWRNLKTVILPLRSYLTDCFRAGTHRRILFWPSSGRNKQKACGIHVAVDAQRESYFLISRFRVRYFPMRNEQPEAIEIVE